MSAYNRVVWSEGLFLQPQHFQQQDRYFERYVETRCQSLIAHSWGFTEIDAEREFLRIGKFGLRRAAGVFPDGTPFRMPEDDPLPPPIDVRSEVRDQLLYLAVPLRRSGELDIDRDPGADDLVRYDVRELPTRDATAYEGEPALLDVAALRTRLVFAPDMIPACAYLPLAHVVASGPDKQVTLDEQFIPTVMHVRAASRLAALITELLGLFHQRGDHLAGRAATTGRGATAEIADVLMLQAINRYEPMLAHIADAGLLHPEELYRVCVSAAGDLATYTTTAKRAPTFPGYRHDRLRESFEPVVAALRASLSTVIPETAMAIPLESKPYGIRLAMIGDHTLYKTATFVLAARADLPAEELRRRFPAQLKIGPVERILDLVTLQLPGVPVVPIPVAPRQLPFHAGFAYFELDQRHELWQQLEHSGGVALHVAGEFPRLTLEFWVIRG